MKLYILNICQSLNEYLFCTLIHHHSASSWGLHSATILKSATCALCETVSGGRR